jgi:hypothetical protein
LYCALIAELDWTAAQLPLRTALLIRKSSFTFADIEATLTRNFHRESQMETNIRSLVEGFVNQIVAAVEADSVRRVQEVVTAAFTGGAVATSRRPGRPAGTSAPAASVPARRRPKQFCPVPGCTGVAAPVFGMVCAKHKDMSKAKIKEYRTQRRAAKAGKN